jgi:hypothetical protein
MSEPDPMPHDDLLHALRGRLTALPIWRLRSRRVASAEGAIENSHGAMRSDARRASGSVDIAGPGDGRFPNPRLRPKCGCRLPRPSRPCHLCHLNRRHRQPRLPGECLPPVHHRCQPNLGPSRPRPAKSTAPPLLFVPHPLNPTKSGRPNKWNRFTRIQTSGPRHHALTAAPQNRL